MKPLYKLLSRSLAAAAAGLILATACTYSHGEPEVVAPCDTLPGGPRYATTVAPIIRVNCRDGCHDTTIRLGNVNFDDFNEVQLYALNGSMVRRIELDPSHPEFMPKGRNKLSACDIARIKTWIAAGATNN